MENKINAFSMINGCRVLFTSQTTKNDQYSKCFQQRGGSYYQTSPVEKNELKTV